MSRSAILVLLGLFLIPRPTTAQKPEASDPRVTAALQIARLSRTLVQPVNLGLRRTERHDRMVGLVARFRPGRDVPEHGDSLRPAEFCQLFKLPMVSPSAATLL